MSDTEQKPKPTRPTHFSAREIRAREYETLAFEGYWRDLIGTPPPNFWMLVYAEAKQGKSYLVTEFADYLTRFGRVDYLSSEEGIEYSVHRRLNELKIDNDRIRFYPNVTKENLEYLLGNRSSFLIVDSPQHLDLSITEAKTLFKKYRKKKAVILIQQVNARGGAKGGSDWDHLVDVILTIEQPFVYQRGRYGGEPKMKTPFATKQEAEKLERLRNRPHTPATEPPRTFNQIIANEEARQLALTNTE